MAAVLRLDPPRASPLSLVLFRPSNRNSSSVVFPLSCNRRFRTSRFPNFRRCQSPIRNQLGNGSDPTSPQDARENSPGVEVALSMLRFYKREISPILPNSCRYIPSCSVYSMEAYKKYGVVKGTVLTAWRLCRCNPLGGSGFDPPRWFDEERPSLEE
ncbi:hypothetical protein SAY86_000530 [Trapa natans]|uniref:Uncharacterized protein n=1 Tax=Trapa natans TaxID=22666 RepID=A0AAN7MNQ1_TRANT|nr:hypothetical protein SAY86_000530 [Trapa natans]